VPGSQSCAPPCFPEEAPAPAGPFPYRTSGKGPHSRSGPSWPEGSSSRSCTGSSGMRCFRLPSCPSTPTTGRSFMTPVAPHRSTPDNHRRGRERAWIATAVLVTVPLIPLVPSTAQEARADTVDEQARLADLVEDIDAILDDPALEGATSGVVVLDPDTGEALYSQEADTQLLPASNMKMFSGAAALEVL